MEHPEAGRRRVNRNQIVAGSGRSIVITRCQCCGDADLRPVLNLGYLPPVNTMHAIGTRLAEDTFYPAELLHCPQCALVQLGCVVDPAILFPDHYAYTSGTTRILRENFAALYTQVQELYPLGGDDLVIDVGSNDGTLLGNFSGRHRVCGIEPTAASAIAVRAGIPTIKAFFNSDSARVAVEAHGKAKLVTATNVFAHMEDVHAVVENILTMLSADGIFVSESHYLLPLIETLQYDTVYHEHLRYYSLTSLRALLSVHGLDVIHASRIPTHGGSIRVFAARRGQYSPTAEPARLLGIESKQLDHDSLLNFAGRVAASKLALLALLRDCRSRGKIYGIGAPSRASTLITYTGLDHNIVDCVLEIAGSYKVGKYMPGSVIPVIEETRLIEDQPAFAILFSWHIADELIPKLRARGYRGQFIVPLPEPRLVDS